MNNSIIELLNLTGDDIEVTNQITTNDTIEIIICKKERITICPLCGHTMHSKGSYTRTVNHPILQDGRKVILKLVKRKVKCSSPLCGYMVSDKFDFVGDYKHSSLLLPYLIIREFRDINATVHQTAQRLNVSNTLVYDTFMSAIKFDRTKLTEVISIDEVYMNFDYKHKYPMVILDFISGEPIDIVNSRRQEDTEPYFYHIPLEERLNVKYLICDMYNPYINYVTRYFPNAQAIVDGFHVKKWILDRLNTYYRSVLKRYKDIEKNDLKRNNFLFNTSFKSIKHSREVNILQDFKFVLFENVANIDYTADPSYNFHLGQYLDTFQKERMFMELDPHFPSLRALKERFNTFDTAAKNDHPDLNLLFDNLIREYQNCDESIFKDFSRLLIKYRKYILASYSTVIVKDRHGNHVSRRLSNSLIESFNVYPKSLKRVSRGLNNFDYARNRILLATRSNESISIPSSQEIPYIKRIGKKRSHYNKK